MSTPSEPGRPPYPDGSGQPGPRPSGPPRPAGPGPGPGPQPSGPGRPGPDQPSQGWVPQPRPAEEPPPPGRSFFGRLLDLGFDDMITPMLVRLFYVLAIVFSTAWALVLLAFGIWVFQYGWLLTMAAFVFTPLLWLLSVILARIFLEAVMVHFKGVEYLHTIKDTRR